MKVFIIIIIQFREPEHYGIPKSNQITIIIPKMSAQRGNARINGLQCFSSFRMKSAFYVHIFYEY